MTVLSLLVKSRERAITTRRVTRVDHERAITTRRVTRVNQRRAITTRRVTRVNQGEGITTSRVTRVIQVMGEGQIYHPGRQGGCTPRVYYYPVHTQVHHGLTEPAHGDPRSDSSNSDAALTRGVTERAVTDGPVTDAHRYCSLINNGEIRRPGAALCAELSLFDINVVVRHSEVLEIFSDIMTPLTLSDTFDQRSLESSLSSGVILSF